MTNNLKIYLIAGEPSGDALGARLMRALKNKSNQNIQFFGIGGDTMEKEGLNSLFDISELAVMGLAEVLPSIPKILKRINQTVNDIIQIKPDILISIDSWSFASRIQKKIRYKKLNIPQVHYVAPQVWAWKKKRAKTMHNYIDHLLTLFPHEPKYFTPYGLKTTFVGHPVIESPISIANKQSFRTKYNINNQQKIISILPGSRHNEVSHLLPIFLNAAQILKNQNPDAVFVIPAVKTVAQRIKNITFNNPLNPIIIENEFDRLCAMAASNAAMAASGTVTLELAIANVPHIIAYKVAPLTAFLAKRLLNIQFVNLSNILIGREIVPELLQERCTPNNIALYINNFLNQDNLYKIQQQGFSKVQKILGLNQQKPSENAADVILNIINDRKQNPPFIDAKKSS